MTINCDKQTVIGMGRKTATLALSLFLAAPGSAIDVIAKAYRPLPLAVGNAEAALPNVSNSAAPTLGLIPSAIPTDAALSAAAQVSWPGENPPADAAQTASKAQDGLKNPTVSMPPSGTDATA